MKFNIKNLGVIKEAELELNNLTIITGDNNSGKTFITETYYGLIKELKQNLKIKLSNNHFNTLIDKRNITFPLNDYMEQIETNINKIVNSFQEKRLPTIFASEDNHFIDCKLNLKIDPILMMPKVITLMGNPKIKISSIEDQNINIKLINDFSEKEENPEKDILPPINYIFSIFLKENFFPRIEYLCAERSSILQFQIDIDGNRSELVNNIQNNEKININEYLSNNTGKFPLVISESLTSVRKIRNRGITKIIPQNNDVINNIESILGGTFEVIDKKILFRPIINSNLKLNLSETSSSVCSLFELSSYLLKDAYKELIFIDEPEMNLHPKNQRKIARLIVMMVNSGYQIVISTHSDIIIREINTMILLNYTDKKNILKEEGYSDLETLDITRLNCYATEKNKDHLTYSLKKIEVSQDEGIEIKSFDNTIEEMNRIQERLIWEV